MSKSTLISPQNQQIEHPTIKKGDIVRVITSIQRDDVFCVLATSDQYIHQFTKDSCFAGVIIYHSDTTMLGHFYQGWTSKDFEKVPQGLKIVLES